jgi:hypothetical protein
VTRDFLKRAETINAMLHEKAQLWTVHRLFLQQQANKFPQG